MSVRHHHPGFEGTTLICAMHSSPELIHVVFDLIPHFLQYETSAQYRLSARGIALLWKVYLHTGCSLECRPDFSNKYRKFRRKIIDAILITAKGFI